MNVVIMAAGKGSRLGNANQNLPKCLVEISKGVLYLDLELQALQKFSFQKRYIIGGFQISALENYFQNSHLKSSWEIIANPDFEKGNLYTLEKALPHLEDGFFLFNADHYYSDENYQKIFQVQDRSNTITAFVDFDRNLTDDDMKVKFHKEQVESPVLKVMSKQLQSYEAGYVGVTYVPKNQLALYKEYVNVCAQKSGDSANVEQVLNFIAEDHPGLVVCEDISGSWWTEIDTVEDLEKAKTTILKHEK